MKRASRKIRYWIIIVSSLLLTVIYPLIPSLCSATLDTAEIVDLYSQAKEMFRKANELSATNPEEAEKLYLKSAMRFEKIAREGGIQNGKLYYNIGNVYFRMKDIGRAILNYRRGGQYIPSDPNLQQNLKYARARRVDKIEERQKTIVLKTLFFWHYDLSIGIRVFIFTLFFMLLWFFLAIRLFIGKSLLGWCIALAATLSFLFAGSLLIDAVYLHKIRPGVVISPEIVSRKGNSETYERSFKEPLHSGTEFTLIEERGNWYHIELHDSRRCWLPKADVELVR